MTDQFSLAQVNNYLWRRQGFDWEHPDSQQPIFGIYGAAPTCYLSHLVRDPNFKFAFLDEAIDQKRELVRIRAMRYSVFLVPVEHLPSVFQATREQALAGKYKIHKLAGLSEDEYMEVSAAVENALGDSTMEIRQIKLALPNALNNYRDSLQYVVPFMCAEGRLVRARMRGGWTSNQLEFARTSKWLPGVNLAAVTPAQGHVNLARLYLDSYGPATLDDLKWWSGLKTEQVISALAGLEDELVKVRVEGQECMLLEKHWDVLADTPDNPPDGLHLLPLWDAYLMAYRSRDRLLPRKHYDTIYDKTGNGTYTIMEAGKACGVWDLIADGNQVTLKTAFFDRQVDSRLEVLKEWLDLMISATDMNKGRLMHCPLPLDLKFGSRNLFESPLKDIEGEIIHSVP